MSKIEIKTNVITNVLTWALIGLIGGALLLLKDEVKIYLEIRKVLPQIEELNKTKEEMSRSYDADIKAINSKLWNLKEEDKKLNATDQELKDSLHAEKEKLKKVSDKAEGNTNFIKNFINEQGN